MFNEYPRVAIIGDTGEGKTTVMTSLAVMYHEQGLKIYSNYELIGIEYTYLDPKNMAELMFQDNSPLHDCVILTDEAHMDLGAYDFLKSEVKDIGDFATQTRKRRIVWLYTTQIFKRLVLNLRDLTTNLIYCQRVQDGIFKMEIYNRKLDDDGYIKTLYLNGVPFYGYFKTTQIIKKTFKPKIIKKPLTS